MDNAYSNINGKIWLFLDIVVEWELLIDTEQQVTIKVYHKDIGKHIILTFVYAKFSSLERLKLWDNLYNLANDMEMPWVVGGDFNVILSEEENIGGLPVYPPEYEDFASCVNLSGLFDLCCKGSPFTWWNGRPNVECIFKRLDRILVNLPFQSLFPNIKMEHLIRTGLNHAPLLMICGANTTHLVKPFRFKVRRVKIALSKWSKLTYGDIFKQLAIREDIVKIKEMLFEEEPTIDNKIVLQKAQAELKRYLSIEEQY
ncbi:uncharacterized protein [Nicotiana tomentosiformis]|uniref:uncharacterized protein n=1 Tax=Nicotiana tomentosiformis TaxID=4098 RepID=UPI00388C3E13